MRKMFIIMGVLALIGSTVSGQNQPIINDPVNVDSAKSYVTKGQVLSQQGKFEEGLLAFEKALQFQPTNEDATMGAMMIHLQQGRSDEAYGIIENWTKIDPGNVKAWNYRMYFQLEMGHTDEALKLMDTIINLQPDSARNWIMKTQTLMQSGHNAEALQSSEKGIQVATSKDPVNASSSYYMNAYALAKNDRYDDALISCNKGIGLATADSYEGIYTRACIHALKGDEEKALADLKLAIEKDPKAREQVKERARADGDFKSLYANETFKELTTSADKVNADNAGAMDSVCSIGEKKYTDKDFIKKVSGSWKATRVYVHGQNLLGKRNFYFTLKEDKSIEIEEPERNYLIKGTWEIGEKDNTITWTMPEKNNSFKGKYDFLGNDLVLSGRGFIGVMEDVCIRLKIK